MLESAFLSNSSQRWFGLGIKQHTSRSKQKIIVLLQKKTKNMFQCVRIWATTTEQAKDWINLYGMKGKEGSGTIILWLWKRAMKLPRFWNACDCSLCFVVVFGASCVPACIQRLFLQACPTPEQQSLVLPASAARTSDWFITPTCWIFKSNFSHC